MTPLTIYCDARLTEAALTLLRGGVSPHRLVFPASLPDSILAKSAPDPALSTADIAFGQPDDEAMLAASRLKWVHLSTAGFTRYDTPSFREGAARRGLVVTTSSSVYAQSCAEHVLAFMLAHSRRLPTSLATRCESSAPEWGALRRSCAPLQGAKVILYGFGGIAQRLVELLAPFKMQFIAVRRAARGDEGVPVVPPWESEAALAEADHVVNILPDNAESRRYFDAARFGRMKRGAVFYNIGRGTTVDQDALAVALRSGHLGEAWLDVTEPEPLPAGHVLRHTPGCYITPHVAGGHQGEDLTPVKYFISNLRRYLEDQPLTDRVM